ncbi:homocysteine S-methyltransferase family protein [Kingella negevensis]|uniref:homocysteine S-methyltransferase family protein n=2 Tax=Kingella negevensis TaxID=1522312 RepID=UPI000B0A3942|nr:homocysteine S-methyltransferase family protein [Kingella negevensis]WII91134.1 homocysteine S-methyltransferase family protein [Kingella negevensis]
MNKIHQENQFFSFEIHATHRYRSVIFSCCLKIQLIDTKGNIMTIILDGGMGRELHRRGAPFRQPEWSALALTEAPEAVRDTHLDFIRAGADMITSNSYAVVPFHIGESRFQNEAEDLAATAGNLAREAVELSGKSVQVAGSLPPLFGSYRPDLFDETKADELAQPLICGLSPFVDLWLAETASSTAEVRNWRKQLGDDTHPFWVSFTLEDMQPHDEPVLRSGESVRVAAQVARELGAAAMLFNCSQPEVMLAAVQAAANVLSGSLKIGLYANAFEPVSDEMNDANDGLDEIRKDTTPQNYLAWATAWCDAGAEIVGGCCGISPEHIGVLAENLK